LVRQPARIVPFLAIALVLATVIWAITKPGGRTTTHAGPQVAVYSPQPERNAEWTGPYGQYSADQVAKLAQNTGILVDDSFSGTQPAISPFANVERLVRASEQFGNHLAVLSYFDSIFLYATALSYWHPYLTGFKPSWYLRDINGDRLAYCDSAQRACDGPNQPVGYLYDIANPAYRAWAVDFIAKTMAAAPYKGVLLDSADQIVGSRTLEAIEPLGSSQTHISSMNALLCPPGAPVDADGDCPNVAEWNASLATFVSDVEARLRPLGDSVIVNGIAPSPLRRGFRNLAIVNHADLAANEDFCYHISVGDTSRPVLEPLAPDLRIMRLLAEERKGAIEITNHRLDSSPTLGDYCLAGFLMGWQPHSSYYVYHSDYRDQLAGPYPEIPEQNLDLGLPLTPAYQQRGSLLYRRFQHGLVAMNIGSAPANFTAPTAAAEFGDGSQRGVIQAGQGVRLRPLTATFFLTDDYLCSAPARAVAASGGTLVLRSAAPARGLTMTYSVDGTRIYRTARFPSSYQVDMRRYSRGTHTLLTDYDYPDGRFTAAARCVTVGQAGASTTPWSWLVPCAAAIGVLMYCGWRPGVGNRRLVRLPAWEPRR
jgi:hypothetical protein